MKRLPRVLTAGEARRLLDAAGSARDRALIAFGLYAGLRRDEMRHLDMGDVDLEAGQVFVRKAKGGKQRFVPLHRELRAAYLSHLNGVLRDEGPLFEGRRGRLADRTIQDIVTKTARRAGLRGVHTHTLRHTFATAVYEAGQDLLAVKDLLGHESVSTTQIYTHLSVGRLRGAVDGFSFSSADDAKD